MPVFTAYSHLSAWSQFLHNLHVLLCAFAVLAAILPLVTSKGSAEHKFGGLMYVPVSFLALSLASVIAWKEDSLILFCFNGFCAYLLLTGWCAAHEGKTPRPIDWAIPGGLGLLATIVLLDIFFSAHPLTPAPAFISACLFSTVIIWSGAMWGACAARQKASGIPGLWFSTG